MSNSKNRRKRRQAKSRRSIKKPVQKQNTLSNLWTKAWKIVVGIGVTVGILVGIKTLFFDEKAGPVTFNQPRFSEESTSFSFSFGGGLRVIYDKDRLEKEAIYPFNFGEFKPVKLYIEDGILYADVSVYGGSNLPPIKIIRNKLIGKPKQWDFNSNDNAIEIINSHGKPAYQLYYKSPTQIIVNGVFPFPRGFVIAGPKGATVIQNANVFSNFSLKPIFKYPSWKYPGQLAEE